MAEKKLVKLTKDQIMDQISEDHPDWFITDDERYVATGVEFETFAQAADFMVELAKFADNLNHHPDVYIYDYNFLQILLRTHSIDGFSELDLEFIHQFDNAFSGMDDDEDTAENIEEIIE